MLGAFLKCRDCNARDLFAANESFLTVVLYSHD